MEKSLVIFRILIIYIVVFIFIFILSISYVFAGIDLIEKREGNFVVYYAKINKTIAKVFYIHKNYYSKSFIKTIDYFTKNVNDYNDVKYVYDDYSGVYSIFLKGKKLVSINKDLAFLSGYSSKEKLLNSYLVLLRNYIDLIPPVFFEKNYLLTLVDKDYYLKIIKKSNLSYNLLVDENLEVDLLNNNLLKISPKKVGNYLLKLVVNYNNKIFEDEVTIDSRVPVFDLPFNNYLVSYSTTFDYIKKINWFDSIILPNIINYQQINLDYNYVFKDKSLIYYILPSKIENNDNVYYLNKEKFIFNFEKRNIYNPVNFDYLIITNNPEKISNEGLIYENNLQGESDYFIWFHHLFLNNKYFIVEIENENYSNVNINYYFDYKVSVSEIQSGINASFSFFDFINNNKFINLSIKPKKRLFLFCKNIPKDNVLTGFVYIKPDKSLKIKIYAINDKFSFNKELNYLSNDNSLRSTGIFEKPFIQKELKFNLSNLFYSLRIPSKEEEIRLAKFDINNDFGNYNYSNYGVLYKLKLNIMNNTPYKQKVFLYGSSISGYTPLVFLYKGNIYRTDSGMYRNLLTFYLQPNEVIDEIIYFLITPGLFYPIELELTTNKL